MLPMYLLVLLSPALSIDTNITDTFFHMLYLPSPQRVSLISINAHRMLPGEGTALLCYLLLILSSKMEG